MRVRETWPVKLAPTALRTSPKMRPEKEEPASPGPPPADLTPWPPLPSPPLPPGEGKLASGLLSLRLASGDLGLDEGDASWLSDRVSVAAGLVFGGGDHGEEGDDLDDEAGACWWCGAEGEAGVCWVEGGFDHG